MPYITKTLTIAGCFIFLAVLPFPALSKYGSVTVASIVSVYDGDTFRANIANWPDIIGNNTPIRVNAVDTPEIRGKCDAEKQLAKRARDFTRQQLQRATIVELRNIERGKYFRLIADVYIDDVNLAQLLIDNGLGRPYAGDKRQSWCENAS